MDRNSIILLLVLACLAIIIAAFRPGFSPPQITQVLCEDSDGVWNECGSACLGEPPGTVCTKECVPTCECLSSIQCPPGYFCRSWKGGEKGACRLD